MARERLESLVSPRVVTGLLSVMLHVGLLLVAVLSGGRHDGVEDDDTPITELVMLESRIADQRDGMDLPPLEPAVPAPDLRDVLVAEDSATPPPTSPDRDADDPPLEPIVAANEPLLASAIEPVISLAEALAEPVSTFVMPRAQASALLQRIERFAEELTSTPRTQVTWNEDGRQYAAELVLERAQNGLELDRVVAEISAEDRGRHLKTTVMLKRLPFSHFSQLIDRWDPAVQLHDDEIVGRMHINSRFNVLYDSEARPTLLGRVSTAARSFNMESTGRRRESDVFRGGIETRAKRIPLSERAHPFRFAPLDPDVRIHELGSDTHIEFRADGSYWWRDRKSHKTQYRSEPSEQPVYFLAARGVTLYVRGVVAGKVLVYSPQRIVVEGSLTYAHDPRDDADSDDYLGLVSDRDIVVAPPYVTGPGDVHIHAALFAKRRFIVTNIEHPRPATLRILGSLAAGSVTASEPRYATKVVYDARFEDLRPPGFPSTDRFAADEWDQRWTDVSDRSASRDF
ncbi:MAG TPA: hypothetical protein VFP48_01890 [Steroidobacteraceae bacterium]|nr:hypothetical protein [Steroidobacteraceae bacterium]